MAPRFTRFREFWPFYLDQHRHPVNRRLHLAGTLGALGCLALGAAVSPWWFAAAPLVGYGFAWLGHFGFEQNRPATFGHPLWSLWADLQLFARMLTGRPVTPPGPTLQADAGSRD